MKVKNGLLVLAVLGILPWMAQAQDRTPLGNLSAQIGDVSHELSVFSGPVGELDRGGAMWRDAPFGQRTEIQIEGVLDTAPPGAHPYQGTVSMMAFFDDGSLRRVDFFHVDRWPAGTDEPQSVFRSSEASVDLDHFDLSEAAAGIAGTASATLCPYDSNSNERIGTEADCVDASFNFDTRLVAWRSPARVEQAPPAADREPPARADAGAEDDSVAMDVLGQVSAALGGVDREWLTLAGVIDGREIASSNWQHHSVDIPGFTESFGRLAEGLSKEERGQLEALDGIMASEDNPLGRMAQQARQAAEWTNVTISGHDPASPNILMEQVLALDVTVRMGGAPLGVPMDADITYIVEASGSFIPDVFYTSEDTGTPATVIFERLDLLPEEGHATGEFSATLCRMEGAHLIRGPDLSDCKEVEGRFDTALIQESDGPR